RYRKLGEMHYRSEGGPIYAPRPPARGVPPRLRPVACPRSQRGACSAERTAAPSGGEAPRCVERAGLSTPTGTRHGDELRPRTRSLYRTVIIRVQPAHGAGPRPDPGPTRPHEPCEP